MYTCHNLPYDCNSSCTDKIRRSRDDCNISNLFWNYKKGFEQNKTMMVHCAYTIKRRFALFPLPALILNIVMLYSTARLRPVTLTEVVSEVVFNTFTLKEESSLM